MAVKLSANYSKKLGLPQYSSHSFSASVEVELSDLSQVEEEVQKLYQLLQHSVDQEIQQSGFVPEANGSKTHQAKVTNGRTHMQGTHRVYHGKVPARSMSSSNRPQNGVNGERWNCTEGQRGFILRILSDNSIPKEEAEDLSQQLFGFGVKQLDKMQASQLIEELLVKAGKPARQSRWQSNPRSTQNSQAA